LKIIANRAELLALCLTAARLATDVSPLDELCGFLLYADADTGQLSVSATNLEVSLQGRMKADIREGGSLVLNGKMGVGMLSKLPGELVVLCDRPNNTLLLAGGKAKYTLGVLPGRRYPPLELPFPADTVQVSGVPAMARRTVFAASDDKTKMAMQCVNLVFSEDGLKAVSSDGSRVMSVKGETKDTGAISMMIPARSLALLAGMCTDEDVFHVGTTGKSIVYMKENFIFSRGGWTVSTSIRTRCSVPASRSSPS
jgi:DNA polymerase III sliding clamp (beta) subunit (PCNA family)